MQHRLSSTFSLVVNWTWSKCLDLGDKGDISGMVEENPNNLRLDYGPCGFDYRHIDFLSRSAHVAVAGRAK
jgi:hypothetical protein